MRKRGEWAGDGLAQALLFSRSATSPTTALCLGQMTANAAQARTVGEVFGLTEEECKWLQVVPSKGSCPPRCRPIR